MKVNGHALLTDHFRFLGRLPQKDSAFRDRPVWHPGSVHFYLWPCTLDSTCSWPVIGKYGPVLGRSTLNVLFGQWPSTFGLTWYWPILTFYFLESNIITNQWRKRKILSRHRMEVFQPMGDSEKNYLGILLLIHIKMELFKHQINQQLCNDVIMTSWFLWVTS